MVKKSFFIFGFFILIVLVIAFLFFKLGGSKGFMGNVISDYFNSEKIDLKDYQCDDCNIVLIVVDALRADHLECYGYNRETSPNICELADEGILFENAISQSAWTRPGVASILTGLYPKNHGAENRNNSLSEDKTLISEVLKEQGYNTFAFVTNGNIAESFGFNQGYTGFVYLKESSSEIQIHKGSDILNSRLFDNLQDLSNSKNFVYIHYTDPHDPYTPNENVFSSDEVEFYSSQDMNKLSRTIKNVSNQDEILDNLINFYDDEIVFTDKNIGNLISWMKEKGIYNNTIIIITSDHGEGFLEHGEIRHGNTLYDELIKIPLIVHIPQSNPKIVSQQVSQVDIFPSVLDLVGLSDIKDNLNIDGKSIFSGFQKYIFSELNLDNRRFASIRTDKEKLILDMKTNKFYDYNLAVDPLEQNNIYTKSKGSALEVPLMEHLNGGFESKNENLPDLDAETLESLRALGYLN